MGLRLFNISDLDETQKRVVEHTPLTESMLVCGPPGSGKTVVAVQRAKMLIKDGFTNILFLTYNHSVVSYVEAMFREMKLINNIDLHNKDKFFVDSGLVLGHSMFGPDSYDTKYKRLLHVLKSNLNRKRFQIVVLDEVQDFLPEELEILKQISETIIAVGDYEQKINENSGDNRSSMQQFKRFDLRTIFRFGESIARMAESFSQNYRGLSAQVTKTANVKPYKVLCDSEQDAVESVAQIIRNRKNADTTMAVVSPHRKKLEDLRDSLALLVPAVRVFFPDNNKAYRDHNFDLSIPVLLTTNSVKGLEFDCVVLYGFYAGFAIKKQRREKLFVSLTRTNNELYLIEENDTISELANIPDFITVADTVADMEESFDF